MTNYLLQLGDGVFLRKEVRFRFLKEGVVLVKYYS